MHEHKTFFETGNNYKAKLLPTPLKNFQRPKQDGGVGQQKPHEIEQGQM